MFGRRKCYCMNNNYQNNSCEEQSDIIEDKCSNVANANFSCNQNEYMDKTFKPCVGLKIGTLFPELVSPYMPGQSMNEIKYLSATNTVKEGCNKCQ